MKQSNDINEEVYVSQVLEKGDEHYHLRPQLTYRTRKIPKRLFDQYVQRRSEYIELRRRIKRYFKPLKDKPMRVEKYHVGEGERHRFNEDGSVSITNE
ncbi:MAG: hypothetical protein M3362_01200 [Acidobacteriota bacterium]|nr:hypothetical protein [Acidobacteriota bacterium]